MRRVPACIAAATVALAALVPQAPGFAAPVDSSSPAARGTTTPTVTAVLAAGPATVAVAVATVWRHRSSPRAVDAPALENPVRIRTWLDTMSLAQRRALSGRADTQTLLGERVTVLAVSGGWARVVVPDQPSPLDSRGYPGWLPARQLVADTASASGTTVTVVTPKAWLRSPTGTRLLRVSFGTRLTALGPAGATWRVVLPDGRTAEVAASRVVTGSLPVTARSIVASARQFLGLSYLWSGNSGFGFDCSGLMETVFRAHGLVIPRDTTAQAIAGRAVTRAALRAGDLVFFARNGKVHHVGMYVGNGLMLHAPHTGSHVMLTPMSTPTYAREYAGARRFLA
jgi:gamma-D-glutamyl-L-lysine dipeptidyl-peptidase